MIRTGCFWGFFCIFFFASDLHYWSLFPSTFSNNYTENESQPSRGSVPCWWRLCRSSSASVTVDWCCGWLWSTKTKSSVWNPPASDKLCFRCCTNSLIRCWEILHTSTTKSLVCPGLLSCQCCPNGGSWLSKGSGEKLRSWHQRGLTFVINLLRFFT